MMTSPRMARPGFSLLELVAVMMALIILGAVLVPSLSGMKGDTHAKAGADVLQSYIAKARTKAIEDGFAYRLAISTDGNRVRIAPDTFESLGEEPTASEDGDPSYNGPTIREDDLPKGVTARIHQADDDSYAAQDQSGWTRLATFLPDGTLREEAVEVRVEEQGTAPVVIRIRGITGSCSISRGGSAP